jgi:hypothetical protein
MAACRRNCRFEVGQFVDGLRAANWRREWEEEA